MQLHLFNYAVLLIYQWGCTGSLNVASLATNDPSSPQITACAYRVSKAALSMVTASVGRELSADKFILVTMSPGRYTT